MTTTTKQAKADEAPAPTARHDVVAVPSLRADGTPDQTPAFVQLAHDVRTDEQPGKKQASDITLAAAAQDASA